MGRIFLIELDGRTYRCRFCDSALALADDVLSRKLCEARMDACKRTRLGAVGVGKSTEEPINCTEPINGTATAAESRSKSVAFAFERCQWCRPQCMTSHAPTELINTVWNCKSLKTRGQLGGENHLVPWVNITLGPEEDRLMYSGLHTVEDIFCCCCGQILGWKYVIAHEKNQKYKEGKFVLERWRIVEDVAEDFNLDARLGSSDGENP